MDRIKDKIKELGGFLDELESILPDDFNKYTADFKIRAICERYCEKIVEAAVDLAFLVIKFRKLKVPEDDKSAFYILQNNGIISESLAKKLRAAKGMRNVIVHEYGKVDDRLVFEAVTEELIRDVEEFITAIEKII